jgi:hypothetical protein
MVKRRIAVIDDSDAASRSPSIHFPRMMRDSGNGLGAIRRDEDGIKRGDRERRFKAMGID